MCLVILNGLCAETTGIISVHPIFNQRLVDKGNFAEQGCAYGNPAVMQEMIRNRGGFVVKFFGKSHVASGDTG